MSSSLSSLYSTNANLLSVNIKQDRNRKYSPEPDPAVTMPIEAKLIEIDNEFNNRRMQITNLSHQRTGNDYEEQAFLIDLCGNFILIFIFFLTPLSLER